MLSLLGNYIYIYIYVRVCARVCVGKIINLSKLTWENAFVGTTGISIAVAWAIHSAVDFDKVTHALGFRDWNCYCSNHKGNKES